MCQPCVFWSRQTSTSNVWWEDASLPCLRVQGLQLYPCQNRPGARLPHIQGLGRWCPVGRWRHIFSAFSHLSWQLWQWWRPGVQSSSAHFTYAEQHLESQRFTSKVLQTFFKLKILLVEDCKLNDKMYRAEYTWNCCFCFSCELPRTPSEQMLNSALEPAGSHSLSAWEMWLVNKAKEDRFRSEKKAEEVGHC